MPEIKHGTVTVAIPDSLVLPPQAGNLSPAEVLAIPKARRGIGLACDQAATALANAGADFVAPGVTPEGLRTKGRMADEIDDVIASVEVLLEKLKQANLLLDAAAWEELRKLNDLVKAQGKFRPELLTRFSPLTEFMSRRRASGGNGSQTQGPATGK